MAFSPEVVTDFVTDGGNLAKIAGAAAFAGLTVKAIFPVGEQQRGLRTRFGKASRYSRLRPSKRGMLKDVGPGVHLTFPGIQSIAKIDVNDRSTDLQTLVVGIKTEQEERQQYRIGSSIVWSVCEDAESLYNAHFRTDTLKEAVTNICVGGLLKVCHEVSSPSELYDSEMIFDRTQLQCAEDLMSYGVKLKGLYLTSVAETEAQVLADAISVNNTSISSILASIAGVEVVPGVGGFGDGSPASA